MLALDTNMDARYVIIISILIIGIALAVYLMDRGKPQTEKRRKIEAPSYTSPKPIRYSKAVKID